MGSSRDNDLQKGATKNIKHLQEEKTHFTQTKRQTQALELILDHSFVWP